MHSEVLIKHSVYVLKGLNLADCFEQRKFDRYEIVLTQCLSSGPRFYI